MKQRLLNKYSKRYIARQFIFVADMVLAACMLAIAFLLRYDWHVLFQKSELVIVQTFYFLGLNALAFFVFRTYRGVIRHTSIEDIVRVLTALSFVSFLSIIGTFAGRKLGFEYIDIPLEIGRAHV